MKENPRARSVGKFKPPFKWLSPEPHTDPTEATPGREKKRSREREPQEYYIRPTEGWVRDEVTTQTNSAHWGELLNRSVNR